MSGTTTQSLVRFRAELQLSYPKNPPVLVVDIPRSPDQRDVARHKAAKVWGVSPHTVLVRYVSNLVTPAAKEA